MQEEQDTCRICSAPAEPDQPLFHPCKCSGTIRYIHQDCLTTWLAHSKKKTCDVCKYPYAFTKVYAPDMPARLPPVLVVRRLAQQAFFGSVFFVRGVVVGIVWLAVLPWVTLWTWRMYFAMGDSTAWWVSDRPRPPSSYPNPVFDNISSPLARNVSHTANDTLIMHVLSHPTWRALSADIFTGQIIACVIVLVFVAIFLLREWIVQNARPGVLEEDEVPAHVENQQEPPRRPLEPEHQDMLEEDRPPPLEHVHDRRMANTQFFAESDSEDEGGEMFADRKDTEKRLRLIDTSDSNIRGRRIRARRKRRARTLDAEDSSLDEFSDHEEKRATTRFRHPHPERLIGSGSRNMGFQEDTSRPSSSSSSLLMPENSQFTFRPPISMTVDRGAMSRIISEPPEHSGITTYMLGHDVPPELSSEYKDFPAPLESAEIRRRQQRDSQDQLDQKLEKQAQETLTEFAQERKFNSVFTFAPPDPSAAEQMFSSNPSTPLPFPLTYTPGAGPSTPRRPPLPSVTLPPSNGSSSTSLRIPPRTPSSFSRRETPLSSPSLATYRPPEEFERDSSNLSSGYFDPKVVNQDALEEEHEHYFRVLEPEELQEESDEQEETFDIDLTPPMSNADSDEEDELDGQLVRVDMMEIEVDEDEDAEIEGGLREVVFQDPQPQPAQALVGPEANEVAEGDAQDDMEGAMEAIGMRGPIYGVLQNAALIIFILDTTIGLGVWVPFTIGKSTALLCLDPRRFLKLVHMPIRVMRIITDPIVDFTLHVLGLWLSHTLYTFKVDGYLQFYGTVHAWIVEALTKVLGKPVASLPDDLPSPEISGSWLHQILESDSTIMRFAEPYLAALGKSARLSYTNLQVTWMQLALGDGIPERVFAVGLGYCVVGVCYALYLNLLSTGNVQSAGKIVRGIVRQQLLIVKMATFITIELLFFPLGCGVVLDLCTVWLFPEATLGSRLVFFRYAPITAIFYHWVAGTMFMYQFAILLAGCRGIMRRGAMWFIKDPQDQNYHPIRDILERPSFTQLRKLLVSAVMYAVVIAFGVMTVFGMTMVISKSTLPLRWRIRQPLSDVPIDLLFLHIALPYTMDYFRPNKAIASVSIWLWKYVAARLRLTSYMFGDRHALEEFTPKLWWSLPFVASSGAVDDTTGVRDGYFKRVPADDNIALPRDMRATAEVNEQGEPLNETAARLIEAQNGEAEKAKRDVKDDYTVVYIPPHFRRRILLFIFTVWFAVCTGLVVSLTLPIQMGRLFFRSFTSREIHDGYSFMVGFYLLWACYLVGYAVDRLDKRRQRRGGEEPRAEWPLYIAKRSLLWVSKTIYMMMFLGVILPILIAVLVEFYLVLPFRYTMDPNFTPRIRVVDMWALGLVYTKIAIRAQRVNPPENNKILRGIGNIIRNGWIHPDPVKATKEVIAPVSGALLAALLCPLAIDWMLRRFLSLPLDSRFLFMHVYPGIFGAVGLSRVASKAVEALSAWSQTVRDKEFLVEMRLQNLQPTTETVEGNAKGNSDGSDEHSP